MNDLSGLRVKLFADGADKAGMLEMYANPLIKGFTTNPTLMRKAGVRDYQSFAREIAAAIPDRPISLEVFADDFDEMERQALEISSWGENINVKIPVMNTKRQTSYDLLRRLARAGVKLNVTALMTLDQVRDASQALAESPAAYVSVFAGACCRHRAGPGSPHGRHGGAASTFSPPGTHLGQSPGAVEHLPGQRRGLPHHYRH